MPCHRPSEAGSVAAVTLRRHLARLGPLLRAAPLALLTLLALGLLALRLWLHVLLLPLALFWRAEIRAGA